MELKDMSVEELRLAMQRAVWDMLDDEKCFRYFDELACRLKEAEATIREQEARMAVMVEALDGAQWVASDDYGSICSECGGQKNDGGHEDYCSIKKALSLASPRAKQMLAVVAAMEKLLVWDDKFPKGRVYTHGKWNECEDELTEIIETVRALK